MDYITSFCDIQFVMVVCHYMITNVSSWLLVFILLEIRLHWRNHFANIKTQLDRASVKRNETHLNGFHVSILHFVINNLYTLKGYCALSLVSVRLVTFQCSWQLIVSLICIRSGGFQFSSSLLYTKLSSLLFRQLVPLRVIESVFFGCTPCC